tara:strand:- start:4589 stop:5041 length:453 start_codon:yes stop_codon:yes gene_type:complete
MGKVKNMNIKIFTWDDPENTLSEKDIIGKNPRTYSNLVKKAEKLSVEEMEEAFGGRFNYLRQGASAWMIRKRQRYERHIFVTDFITEAIHARCPKVKFHTAEDLDNPKIAQQLEWHQQIHWIKDVVFTIPEGNEDGTDRIITWNGEEAVN